MRIQSMVPTSYFTNHLLFNLYSYERQPLRAHLFSKEYTGMIIKIFRAVGGKKGAGLPAADPLLHIGMALQVVCQAIGHNFSLRHHRNARRQHLLDLWA